MTIYTDLSGRITEASEQACGVLGLKSRHPVGQQLPLFFTKNRHHLIELMNAAAGGLTMKMPTVVQGLKGGRRPVMVEIRRVGSAHQDLLEWVMLPMVEQPT